MVNNINTPYNFHNQWIVFGESVIGDSHKKIGLPNQDAIRFEKNESSETPLPLILAIADGHGSAKHFRSHIGAKIAVDIAIDELKNFSCSTNNKNISFIKSECEVRLTRNLVGRWLNEVVKHYEDNLFSEEDLKTVENNCGSQSLSAIENNKKMVYGSTLLAVLVTDNYIIYLQLGDGDILVVNNIGEVKKPIPRSEEFIANETSSLCSDNAWSEFKVAIESIEKEKPAMIFVSTDGLSNSYSSDEIFSQLGCESFKKICANCLEDVNKNIDEYRLSLPDALLETTVKGSGDDITLGIICKKESFIKIDKKNKSSLESNNNLSKTNSTTSSNEAENILSDRGDNYESRT